MRRFSDSSSDADPAPDTRHPARRGRPRGPALGPALLRYAWASPATALGLLLALAARAAGARGRVVDGVLEVGGGRLGQALRLLPRAWRFEAITFGHVVLGRSAGTLARLRAHEQVHVRQYERWGALFLPAYLASSVWQLVRGRDPYRDNRFEREAFAATEPRPSARRPAQADPAPRRPP